MSKETDWPLVWLLWAAGLGAAAQYGKISVIFDRLPEAYPNADAALGFAVSLVGLVGILLGAAAGVVVARIGYRRTLIAALAVGAAVSAVQSVLPPLPLFLATRIIEGAAHLAIVVAAPTLIAEISAARDTGRALTLWSTFFGVAFAILAWAGIPLAAAHGLGAVMAAHAAYLAVVAILLGRRLPRLAETPRAPALGNMIRAHARIYASPSIGAPAFGWLFYTTCFVSLLTVFPPFLPDEARAATAGAMPLASIFTSLTLGIFLLRFAEAVTVIQIGFTACACVAVLLIFMPGAPALALLLGGGLGLVQSATFAAVPQLNASVRDRALANGGLAQMGNLGNTLGTPLMVGVIAFAGYSGLMGALAALFLLGAATHLMLARMRRREH